MKKISIALIIATLLLGFGCQKVKQKLKQDLKKADSLAQIAADSISEQISSITKDTVQQQTTEANEQPSAQQVYNVQGVISIYRNLLANLKNKDSVVLYQFLYFPDSVLTIKNQGIFQVITMEHLRTLLDYLPESDSAWDCQVQVDKWPKETETGWQPQGCFLKKVKQCTRFSAILELNKEANIPINPQLEIKVKQLEPKIKFKIINTYLNWTFYFAYENDLYYLAAIDFNQY